MAPLSEILKTPLTVSDIIFNVEYWYRPIGVTVNLECGLRVVQGH